MLLAPGRAREAVVCEQVEPGRYGAEPFPLRVGGDCQCHPSLAAAIQPVACAEAEQCVVHYRAGRHAVVRQERVDVGVRVRRHHVHVHGLPALLRISGAR